ncbi:MAG: hypothetical protein AAGB16_02955, partial [Pseudomonadota bacterium]
RLSFSLFRDKKRSRIQLAQPGLSRAGAIRQYVFHDLNANGRPDPGEPPIEGAKFIVENALRPETTDAAGYVLFGGLTTNRKLDVEFQLSSLEDPFLRPQHLGQSTIVRAGQIVEMITPVQSTGDVEGVLLLINGETEAPISGVEIEFVDAKGRIVTRTRTEFDGYFYMDGLPMGKLEVRVSPDALQKTGTVSSPVSIELTVGKPSVYGLDLRLLKQADNYT